MIRLGVNVDHVATLRQARGINEPDPVYAATVAEMAGAEGITIHLREDRRHIQDRDVRILRETITTKMNLEMAAVDDIATIALDIGPEDVCLVPEKREELTTEGGVNVKGNSATITRITGRLQDAGITVSLFIDPDKEQLLAAHESGARYVELHTGTYAAAVTPQKSAQELETLIQACTYADELGLKINAGHGLNYRNVAPVAAIPLIEELNIGHAIIGRAVMTGLDTAVREMIVLMREARRK